jgi:hypothetical protein
LGIGEGKGEIIIKEGLTPLLDAPVEEMGLTMVDR